MKKFLLSMCSLTLLISLFSCDTDINSMLENYNENFKEPVIEQPDPNGPYPGDDDFYEEEMLQNEYFVYDDATIILTGPANCSAYSWVVVDTEDKNTPIEVVLQPGSSMQGRVFSTFIPNSGLKTGKTYKVTLTVTAGGKNYRDSCGLIIYRHYTY